VASSRPRLGGGRSSILAAALVALAAAWWLPGDGEPRGGTAAFPPPGGLAGGFEREMAPIEEPLGDGRAGAAAESSLTRTPAAEPGVGVLADVGGRVLAGGLPVVEQEIELVPLAGTAAHGAWDLTDEEGLYEVKLAPGRYAVLLDGILAPEVFLEVPGDALQVRSNLTLANVAPAD
jgi:hypothetical protein